MVRLTARLVVAVLVTAGSTTALAQVDVWGQGFDLGYPRESTHHHRVFVDVNSDGRSDYCRVLGDGQQIACALSLRRADGTGYWQDTAASPSNTSGWPEARRWADIDGDGRPEFCRLNGDRNPYGFTCSSWTEGGWVNLAYTTIPMGMTGARANVSGLLDRRFLDLGDVNGDGRADLCFRQYTAGAGDSLRCILSTGSGFSGTWDHPNVDMGHADWPRSWVDFNGDGFSDYCRVVGGGPFYVRCTLGGSTGFAGEVTSGAIDRGYKEGAAFVDSNGDGKTDYCRVVGSNNHTNAFVRCLLSTGTGWATDQEVTSSALDWGHGHARWWTDVNGDGLTDYCRTVGTDPNHGATTLSCRLSRGDSFGFSDVSVSNVGAGHEGSRAWCDANGDGRPEFCRVSGHFNDGSGVIHAGVGRLVSEPPVITSFGNGLGAETRVTYQFLTHPDVYTRGGVGGWPRRLLVQPASLVVRETRVQGTDGRMLGGRNVMHYEQLRVNTEGRGSLGFAKRWVIHEGNNTAEVTEYFQGLADGNGSRLDDFREWGAVKRTQRYVMRNGPDWVGGALPSANQLLLVQQTENILADTVPGAHGGYRYIGTSVQQSWDLNPSEQRLELPTVTTTSVQDFYGNVTRTERVTSHGGSEWGRQLTENTVENWTDHRWILGRLTRARVTHTAPDVGTQMARLPTSAGSSPNASANTYTPPGATSPLPAPVLDAIMAVITSILLDDEESPAATVGLTASPTTATAPATITLNANAAAASGRTVTRVEFYNGSALLGSDTTAPYSFTWSNVAAGTYNLTARVIDSANASATSSATTVTVTAAAAPTVGLTASPTTATAPATITLNANAAAASGRTVTRVEFYNGSTLLGSDTTAPYSYTWSNVAAGTYNLTARVIDSTNASATSSATTVTVTVTAAAAPTVSASFSPTTVTWGQNYTVNWSSTNATAINASCTYASRPGGSWSGALTVPSGSNTGTPDWNGLASCTVTATGPGGTASTVAQITAVCPSGTSWNGSACVTPAPTVSASFSPTTVTWGQNYTVNWSSTNATAINASCTYASRPGGPWSGALTVPSGSNSGTPDWNGLASCTVTATGPGGTASAVAQITAVCPSGTSWNGSSCATPPPTVALSPASVRLTRTGQGSLSANISASVSGGVAPFSYSWSSVGGWISVANAQSSTATFSAFVPLCDAVADTARVVVTDAQNRSTTATVSVMFQSNPGVNQICP